MVRWSALESNPEAYNEFLGKMGIKGAECCDVLGFDDELIELIPKPHLALMLCYPDYKKVDAIMKPVYAKIKEEGGDKIPEGVFFMKQKISNACGTFSLFHALAQNINKIDIGDGPFAKWYEEAKKLGVDERSDSLQNSDDLATAHDSCAEGGETEYDNDKVEHHFITYVNLNGTLYEFGEF
jgi:ubiquitin carboxyl-terminal hydrolase L3